MSTVILMVKDEFQSLAFRRLDYDVEKKAIPHNLVGGGRLWESHGGPDGSLVDAESILADPGLVIACYPKRVAERYPGLDVVLPEHDGTVVAEYARGPMLACRHGDTVEITVTARKD